MDSTQLLVDRHSRRDFDFFLELLPSFFFFPLVLLSKYDADDDDAVRGVEGDTQGDVDLEEHGDVDELLKTLLYKVSSSSSSSSVMLLECPGDLGVLQSLSTDLRNQIFTGSLRNIITRSSLIRTGENKRALSCCVQH